MVTRGHITYQGKWDASHEIIIPLLLKVYNSPYSRKSVKFDDETK